MNALAIGGVVFLLVFGGAIFGMYLRVVLPNNHKDMESRDVIKVAMAMIATLAALVIGLLIASAKSSFDNKVGTITRMAAQAVLLDRTLAEYGPETREVRDLLRNSVAASIDQIWPRERAGNVELGAIGRGQGIEELQHKILGLTPQNDDQRWLKTAALQISQDAATARWLVVEQLGSSIQWPFLTTLVFWLIIIFASFGLLSPRNITVVTALLASALSVAGSIYLILEMDQPYSGLIKIPSASLNTALGLLGH
jgi:hypothetical protein